MVIPDFCGDLLDDQTLPPLYIVESLSVYFGLSMQYLVHVHASLPCLTNSRADASNVNRGCGYRDWHSPFCKPLPASSSDPIPANHTSLAHHIMAVSHDHLERKLFASLVHEGYEHQFSFTIENPVGAF